MKAKFPTTDARFVTAAASIPNGSAFKFFIRVDKSGIALTSDTGYGKTAIGLSLHFSLVICLCQTKKSADIIQMRLVSKNISNVLLVVGDYSSLPFKAEIFSNISLHDIPSETISQNPKSFIRHCLDLVLEEGDVYFSYSQPIYHYHKKLMLFLRLSISILFSRASFRTRIHHYPSLKDVNFVRTIRKSSFSNLTFELKRLIKGNNIGFIFGKHKDDHMSLAKEIQKSIASELNQNLKLNDLVLVGSHASVICDLGTVIVRLPQSIPAVNGCNINYTNLRLLDEHGLPFSTPAPLTLGEVNGQKFFVESKLTGSSLDMHKLTKKEFQHYRALGAKLLLDPKISNGEQTLSTVITECCLQDIQDLAKHLTTKQRLVIQKTIDALLVAGENITIPKTIQHGDFKYSNFLACDNAISGIIDWDMAIVPGLPLVDILTISIYEYETTPNEFAETILTLVQKKPPNHLVQEYCTKYKIENYTFNLICFLVAVRYLNKAFSPHVKSQKNWRYNLIDKVLIPTCHELMSRL